MVFKKICQTCMCKVINKKISQEESQISQEEYLELFPDKVRKAALEHALDIRKFEIELYWKRATYFWTFIAATFAGYGAVFVSKNSEISKADLSKTDLLVVLSCLGVVFSFGWFLVNRGSKQWQENWENHVDMLEDEVIGPLYKTVLSRPSPNEICEYLRRLFTGPSSFSVSNINQIISLYVTFIFIFLFCKALPISLHTFYIGLIRLDYFIPAFITLLTCSVFLIFGRSHSRTLYSLLATKRTTEITLSDSLPVRKSKC